jgi:hypothetical protein
MHAPRQTWLFRRSMDSAEPSPTAGMPAALLALPYGTSPHSTGIRHPGRTAARLGNPSPLHWGRCRCTLARPPTRSRPPADCAASADRPKQGVSFQSAITPMGWRGDTGKSVPQWAWGARTNMSSLPARAAAAHNSGPASAQPCARAQRSTAWWPAPAAARHARSPQDGAPLACARTNAARASCSSASPAQPPPSAIASDRCCRDTRARRCCSEEATSCVSFPLCGSGEVSH